MSTPSLSGGARKGILIGTAIGAAMWALGIGLVYLALGAEGPGPACIRRGNAVMCPRPSPHPGTITIRELPSWYPPGPTPYYPFPGESCEQFRARAGENSIGGQDRGRCPGDAPGR